MTTASLSPDVKTRKDRMGYWRDHQGKSLLVTPLVSEEMLARFYMKLKADNLLDIVWSEAPVTLSWFLTHYQRDQICTLAAMKEDPETKTMEIQGLGWIVNTQVIGNTFQRSEVGIAYLRGARPDETLIFSSLMVDYCFESMGTLSLYTTSPAPNVASIRHAKAVGFEMFGPLAAFTTWVNKKTGQREPCGAYIGVISRELWEANRS
jgi:hypothetical protein